jgi:GT2 family glycosyltransferase
VICTRDRPGELERCLASLPEQTYPPREIIVVDNASRDQRTRDVALAAGATYVREDRPGLDFARNTGAQRATSEVVAYTDDDVLLHPRWLERLVGAFDRPDIMASTGLLLPGELATEAQRHFEIYWGFSQGYRRKDFNPASFAAHKGRVFPAWDMGAGASMAFRRELFDRIGYFDERLDVGQAGCSGDSEFWYRLLANGYSCRYEPSSVAFHFHRRTMEGLSSQIFHYMRGHVAALLVQYERTGIRANLKQAFYRMPSWYASRLWARLRGGPSPTDRFLKEEILGCLSGLFFYYRQRLGGHGHRCRVAPGNRPPRRSQNRT